MYISRNSTSLCKVRDSQCESTNLSANMPDTNIEMKFDVFVIMLHSFTIQSLNVSAYFSDFNYRSCQKYIKVQNLAVHYLLGFLYCV